MKDKIITWLLKKLILHNTEESNLDIVYRMIKHLYSHNVKTIIDKELDMIIFNAKYIDDMKDDSLPYDIVQDFFKTAGKGSNKYKKHYFYRILWRDRNKQISRINYKYKRNVN